MSALTDSIIAGEYDAELAAISLALDDRQRYLQTQKLAEIRPGDTVRIAGTVRPKMLAYLELKVTAVDLRQGLVIGNLVNGPRGKWGAGIRLPKSLVESKV